MSVAQPASVRIRLIRLGLFSVAAALLIVLSIMAWAAWQYARLVLHPGCQGDLANLDEAGFHSEAVTFTSRDGSTRRGWFTPSDAHRNTVIIVLPGHGGNTRFALP